VARIELAPEVAEDLDRIFDQLAAHGAQDAPWRVAEIEVVFVLALRSQREAGFARE
jgi:hypothetical protein